MSTKQHETYWKEREADWKTSYFDTWTHPHRAEILRALNEWKFGSLFEIGCNAGPNLHIIQKAFPNIQVGGLDINEASIETAKQLLGPLAVLQAGKATDIFLSDGASDVIMTDACLIYIAPSEIDRVIEEIKRIGRKYVLFVEFHSISPFKRLGLKLAGNYYAYNYKKLLEKHGFADIEIRKLPDYWNGEPWKTFGHLITAKI